MSCDKSASHVHGTNYSRQHTKRLSGWHLMLSQYPHAVLALLVLALVVNSARAVNPSLSGSLTVPFIFVPDDPEQEGNQSYYYWSQGISGGIGLSVPSVLDITTSVLGSDLSWNNPSIWNLFPLDSGGLFITHSGSGTYNVSVNSGSPYLNVLGGSGPTEGTVQTRVDFTNIHGSGTVDGFGDATVISNVAATKYNVTIPAGASVIGYGGSNVQNLTISHGAALTRLTAGGGEAAFGFVRQNLTNHGSAELNGEVQGNFINDALPANGDVANAVYLVLDGQLQNTGELRVPQYFKTVAATSNAGTIKILNTGQFSPGAAFANNGLIEFSGTIDGAGVVTNNGTFQWLGQGSLAPGAEIVNATSAFTIGGTNTNSRFLGGKITNNGTITQSGPSALEITGTGTLDNQAGALYDIIDDSHVSYDYSGTINNAGTFRKSGGSGDSIVGAAFDSTGTLAVTSGKVRLRGGGSLNGGSMSFSGGHEAEFYAGNLAVVGTNAALGNGALEFSGAHVFADTGVSSGFANFSSGANLLLTGGLVEAKAGGTLTFNLTGASTVIMTGAPSSSGGVVGGLGSTINAGNFQWVHGSVVGNFTNNSNNFTIVAGDQRIEQDGQLTNTSTSTISQGDGSNLSLAGTINNQAGALWTMTATNIISNGSLPRTINNAGTWRKSGPSTTSSLQVTFNNIGTLAIDSGKLFTLGPNILNFTPSGTLSFTLSGLTSEVDFGKIDGTHSLTVGGKFLVTLGTGFSPELGNSFDLIDWCSSCTHDGTFSQLTLPLLASGLKWDSSQLYVSGVLSISPGIPGDFNQNEVVDAADYVVWRKYLGTIYTENDYNDWRSNFGVTAGSGLGAGTNAAVPEPATGLLILTAGLLALCFHRRVILPQTRLSKIPNEYGRLSRTPSRN